MNDETSGVDVRRASRRRLLAAGVGGLALLAGCSGPGTGEDGEGGEEEENEGEEDEAGGEGEEEGGEEDGSESEAGEEGGEDDLRAGPDRRDARPARGPAVR